MMSPVGTNTIIHILLLLKYSPDCVAIRSGSHFTLANLGQYPPQNNNPYSCKFSRLNLAIGGDVARLSNGKGVLIVNDNKLASLVKSHLSIAGIINYVYRANDGQSIAGFVWDTFNLYGKGDIPSNISVVVGCNLTNLQYFWWKIKCLLNNLVLITADCYNSNCTVSNHANCSDNWSVIRGLSKSIGYIFSKNDSSILATELTASIVACESIKSITNTLEPIKTPWNKKIETPQSRPINILLIGAGAVGCEMVRMLQQMGFLAPGSKLTVVDFDIVDTVNLSTQLVYNEEDVGKDKVAAIKKYLTRSSIYLDKPDYLTGKDLDICTISAKFDGNTAKKIFSDWIKSCLSNKRDKLIIAAVDNFKARMLIDRYSLLYQIPLLEIGIDGTKGSSSISIPYLTDPYSSMPGSDSTSNASCSVKGIPNDTNDTAMFGKLVVTNLLFKGNNFDQTSSQLRNTIMTLFPLNNEDWFIDEVESVLSLSLEVQNGYIKKYSDNEDVNNYLQKSDKSRLLMVKLANLRARVFGLEPNNTETILAMIDNIVPSASFTTSSIVALALSNLTGFKYEKTAVPWFREYRNNDYKLSCDKGIMTLYRKDKPMLWLKMHKYKRFFPIKNNYFWYFLNLANCNFTPVAAPEIEVWWPSRKSLFGKTRIGLSVWDVFNPSTYEMTLNDLALCYEEMFRVRIVGFVSLANNMEDQVLQLDDTKLCQLADCLGLRPIAKMDNQIIQLPDTLLD